MSAMAEMSCVTSTYAVQPQSVAYVDIRPHAATRDRFPSQVLQVPLAQLLASNALQQHALVLIDNPRPDDSKESVCENLKNAGYADVRFLRESAPDLTWRHDKPALKILPAHGWQVISAADVHHMLGEISYRPVYITMGTNEPPAPAGFEILRSLDDLESMAASDHKRQLVVFPPHSSFKPVALNIRSKRNLWWVTDGIAGFHAHERMTMQAFLQRTNRFRLCE